MPRRRARTVEDGLEDIRARGTTSVRKIAEELNHRGILAWRMARDQRCAVAQPDISLKNLHIERREVQTGQYPSRPATRTARSSWAKECVGLHSIGDKTRGSLDWAKPRRTRYFATMTVE